MDIKNAPRETQIKWLQQRGWTQHPERPLVFIDPDTRINYYIGIAIERALADCRVDGDTQLKVEAPARKDDCPPPAKV